ncbi:hypothetical protein UVI_02060990 [Ustilaginoidea virens]|uniref:Cytochrome P450 family protein n=1 Tax=Ustilaginoidea virens TaxID=1159556 RepID=A0A1B5L414_USTVR|nr:hypothetical protein UVI_02060990 [Ustilaginoidea virens]
MTVTVLLLAPLAAAAAYAVVRLFFPLPDTRGIPTIPFWVALLPLVKDVDQQDIFARYIDGPLRKHGAVKLFFASRWNILLHQPSLLADVFRHESVYQKSGNQNKIPHSVLASLLGDNIISSRGQPWHTYRHVIKPGLQAAPDLGVLLVNARKLCRVLVEAQAAAGHGGVGVQSCIQRYTIANFAQVHFGVDFGTLESSDAYLHQIQYRIKREIFKPVFLNFPFLDRLGLPSRRRARWLASHFTDQLVLALDQASQDSKFDSSRQPLTTALLEARRSGTLTEKQFRDNVTVLFVAGQENPQLAIISTLYLLAKHPHIQEQLHKELSLEDSPLDDVTQESLHSIPLLSAVVYESLRLFPPIGQLVNRQVAQPILLGGRIHLPQGTYVGYNCYSTNRDPGAWGADADAFRPSRWGTTCQDIQKEYRRRRSRAEFISFHGGQRACLGERFALLQLKATLYVLLRSLQWKLDPTWPDRMTPAGPLCPRNLRLVFEQRVPRSR